ncbi:MAG TPA: hypothetical protein VKI65_10400 [Gemmataceae bacterium]|nr:hypothetical protein [Gemmataceae bacterium]
MLGLLTRRRWPRPATRPHSVRLALEALETRDLMAAPVITSFTATTLPGHIARLTGTVTDENPATVHIRFSGAASGDTTVDATGHFSFSTTNAVLGSVTATGLDQENLSATAMSTLSSSAPVITNFKAIMGSFGFWTFTGKVTDEDPSHCVVKFSGLPELEGKTTTVALDGTFSYTVQLQPGETGMVLATATDCWGLTSAEAEAVVS